ncbi:hypothetical protein XENOCAPTIV_015476, partial [Xenoophorus captivus]
SKPGRKVVYGCSELFNAAQFMKQVRTHLSCYIHAVKSIKDVCCCHLLTASLFFSSALSAWTKVTCTPIKSKSLCFLLTSVLYQLSYVNGLNISVFVNSVLSTYA